MIFHADSGIKMPCKALESSERVLWGGACYDLQSTASTLPQPASPKEEVEYLAARITISL